jgi:hypothetical protein
MTMTATPPAQRRVRWRETPEVADGARRLIRAVGRRAETDIDALPLLAQLAAEADQALAQAVQGCRAFGWSWTDVGRVLGVTRQAAQRRFGHLDGAGDC